MGPQRVTKTQLSQNLLSQNLYRVQFYGTPADIPGNEEDTAATKLLLPLVRYARART